MALFLELMWTLPDTGTDTRTMLVVADKCHDQFNLLSESIVRQHEGDGVDQATIEGARLNWVPTYQSLTVQLAAYDPASDPNRQLAYDTVVGWVTGTVQPQSASLGL